MLDIDPALYAAIKRINQLGGTVATDSVPVAAAGTGTSRASISTSYQVPSWAKMLLAVRPYATAGASAAAADVVVAQFDIQGKSFKQGPLQLPFPLTGPVLSSGGMPTTPSEWWQTNMPLQALAQYDYGVTPLVANAHNFKAGVDLYLSSIDISKEPGFEPIVSQMSAIQTATASGNTSFSAAITTVDADSMIEYGGAVMQNGTITAAEKAMVDITLQSTGLADIQQVLYALEPTGVVVSTTGMSIVPKVTRILASNLRFKSLASSINYTAANDSTLSNAYNMFNFIRYRQKG